MIEKIRKSALKIIHAGIDEADINQFEEKTKIRIRAINVIILACTVVITIWNVFDLIHQKISFTPSLFIIYRFSVVFMYIILYAYTWIKRNYDISGTLIIILIYIQFFMGLLYDEAIYAIYVFITLIPFLVISAKGWKNGIKYSVPYIIFFIIIIVLIKNGSLPERYPTQVLEYTLVGMINLIAFFAAYDWAKEREENKVKKKTEELNESNQKLIAARNNLQSAYGVMESITDQLLEAQRIAEVDMNMAANIQKSLFPKATPSLDKWDLAFEFFPMSGVSGDFYDFYVNDGNLAGLSICDVSGHGIASGLITMIARNVFFRNFSLHAGSELNIVFDSINREMVNEIDRLDYYLTGIILRFNGNVVEYVNAGHTDLILREKSSGEVKIMDEKACSLKGMFIGSRELEQPSRMMKFKIATGDVLLLFTDCLIESQNKEGEEFGTGRLMATLEKSGDGTAAEILKHILDEFYEFMKTRVLGDDLTIIVLKSM